MDKTDISELIDVREETLVSIINGPWAKTHPLGIVEKEGPEKETFEVRLGKKGEIDVVCKSDELFPLAQDCGDFATPESAFAGNFPRIIQSIGIWVKDLQNKTQHLEKSKPSKFSE